MKTNQTPKARLTGLLGMAQRARRLTVGFDASAALIAGGKASIILLADDLSPKTEKELRFAAEKHPVDIFRIPLNKEELGHFLGLKKPAGVLAIEDKGFAASIQKLCRDDLEEECIL